ncbi:MAG: tetratricopeptide repeat protein [Deltaproteobacteria bacterium]|nr:MAG: tetratricopeptide repeat protein [Deltaproteobacteria bacterium]
MPEPGDPARETIDDSAVAAETRPFGAAATLPMLPGDSGAPDDEPAPLPPGAVIGHFVVEEQLGAGGMGVVVAARDQLLERKVAIKVLRRLFSGVDSQVRLLREAQAMARLQHPNVVTVFEAGTHDGLIFIAMELVEGCTLARWLRDQPRTVRAIVEVFARAGRGLAAAHQLGMVHRDFKPENVLVGRDGQVRVTDFGLVGMARGSVERAPEDQPLGRASPLDQPLTRTGALLGTPLYMAPEQHLLLPVTAQVDQFAFCVALHEALYGVPPFRGATVRELRDSVLSGVPVRPAAPAHDVPPWLRSIVLRGLALSPGERWPDMDGLLDALTRDPSARRRWWVGAGAGLAGALAVAAFAHRAVEPPPCPAPDDRLAGVWDGSTRAAVEHAFAATGRPYAADTFGRVAGALDGYARSWIAMRTAACEATAVRHEQSPALLDRRMQCLDRRLVELGALSALFRGSDPIVVDRAVSATLGLVPLAACADADGLLAQVPLPADPPGRAEATALRGELARATALTRAGKPKEALAAVAPLVPRSRALGYAPVLAEVLLQLGITQRDVGDPRVAEATVIEAARTGAEAKDDTLVAKALIEQMWIVGYRGGRRAEALALTPYIEAAVTRAGGDPIVLGGMYRYEAILLNAEARFGEALAVAERALALYQRANPDGREVANALITMGNIHSDRDDLAQARAAYERAHAIYALLYGPNHPDVATAQTNLANVLFKQGKLERHAAQQRRHGARRPRAVGRGARGQPARPGGLREEPRARSSRSGAAAVQPRRRDDGAAALGSGGDLLRPRARGPREGARQGQPAHRLRARDDDAAPARPASLRRGAGDGPARPGDPRACDGSGPPADRRGADARRGGRGRAIARHRWARGCRARGRDDGGEPGQARAGRARRRLAHAGADRAPGRPACACPASGGRGGPGLRPRRARGQASSQAQGARGLGDPASPVTGRSGDAARIMGSIVEVRSPGRTDLRSASLFRLDREGRCPAGRRLARQSRSDPSRLATARRVARLFLAINLPDHVQFVSR